MVVVRIPGAVDRYAIGALSPFKSLVAKASDNDSGDVVVAHVRHGVDPVQESAQYQAFAPGTIFGRTRHDIP